METLLLGRGRHLQCIPRRQCCSGKHALGTGVADDKAIYAYVPAIIRYYLAEDPILNNVETLLMTSASDREHVCSNHGDNTSSRQSVSPAATACSSVHTVQPSSSKKSFALRILAEPRNYIAQPTLALSTAPCFIDGRVEPQPRRSPPVCSVRRKGRTSFPED